MFQSRQASRWAGVVSSVLVCLAGASLGLAQQDNNLVYEIFVRSFADTASDTAPAGSPGEIGDLKGLREKLDYLNDGDPKTDTDLEVGILWLMPIFPSTSYHGYDVTDFNNVNPDYGSLQDLKDLVQAAHQRGVRVILDIPFNHTSTQHPWFQQAVEDPTSRFRKFYHFSDAAAPAPPGTRHIATSSTGSKVRYLGVFGAGMPDLNFDEPAVHRAVKAVAKFWLDQGIDGFRLDAAKHIYGVTTEDLAEYVILHNNEWWREFSDTVYQIKPDAVLVGEVLGDRETLRRHAYGNDALLDEPFMKALRSRITYPASGFVTDWKKFVEDCRQVNHDAHQGPGMMPRSEPFQPFVYAASHDANPRLASCLEQAKSEGMQAGVDEACRVGMYLLLSMGKYAVLYDGDEIMQRGWKWNGNPPNGKPPGDGSFVYDETLREPFPWHKSGSAAPQTGWFTPRYDKADDGISADEQDAAGRMLDLVRGLTNLRTQHPGFANGELGAILTDSPDWLVFEKVSASERYLVLINPTGNDNHYRFHEEWFPRYLGAKLIFWSDGRNRLWGNETGANKHIDKEVLVSAYGMVLLQQKHP
jgi:alpha-amylase